MTDHLHVGDLVRLRNSRRTGLVVALTDEMATVRFASVRVVIVPRVDVIRVTGGVR